LIPGGVRDSGYLAAVERYLKRAAPTFRCALEPVKAAKRMPIDEARRREAAALSNKLDPRAALIVLDERGRSMDTPELSRRLGTLRDNSRSCDFLIGSAHGLSKELRERADLLLALSPMTLPHELATVVLAEQLYRCASILRGDPYHRGG